jgi:hypothetical protein
MSIRSLGTFAATTGGTILGATAGLVAAALLADFVARTNGSSAAWALGLLVLTYTAIPAIAIGALTGRWAARRRARRDAAASLAGVGTRAPTHPVGLLAGLILGLWATVILLDVTVWASQLLRRYVAFIPAANASALLLLRVGVLVGIWQIGRGTSRAVSDALDTRGGRPRLLDVAIVGAFLAFCALSLAGIALQELLVAPSVSALSDGAILLGIALLIGLVSRALLRRSRHATRLALAVGSLIVGAVAIWMVLAPPVGVDAATYQATAILTVVMASFVLYVRWRLPDGADRANAR